MYQSHRNNDISDRSEDEEGEFYSFMQIKDDFTEESSSNSNASKPISVDKSTGSNNNNNNKRLSQIQDQYLKMLSLAFYGDEPDIPPSNMHKTKPQSLDVDQGQRLVQL